MKPSTKLTLGAVVTIKKGKKHSVSEAPSQTKKRLIGIDDLRNDDLIRFTNDQSGTESVPDDILIAWDGANAGTIGFGKSGFIGSTIARLRSKEKNQFYTPFLGEFLKSKFDYLRQTATGATIPHINRKALEGIVLPNIGLDDQKRIAYVLGKVEGLIAQRKQHLQQLDDLLKSVFLEMFGDPVRNEKGWETLSFDKVGKFSSGGTPSKKREDFWSGSFPWVSPKDMKTSKITDSIDHVSELVFEETTLKRIPPNHLLIVVRGMILAHSFPVAINTVEVSINQDMKAIKPIEEINVVYLQNCLSAQKRQVLELVTLAGHGTRRFDATAMQTLLVPVPPPSLQNRFAGIAEKVESIKSLYQQSLTDLETLYGALSQKAFKGELDLSQVPLPSEDTDAIAAEPPETSELPPTTEPFNLPAPPELTTLHSAEGRHALINQWLTAWLTHLNDAPFSPRLFIEAAQQRLIELAEEEDLPEWSLAEYNSVQAWVFEALGDRRLTQTYDDAKNRVQLHAVNSR